MSGFPDLSAVQGWFAESELGPCPACGTRAVPSSPGCVVCLECGEILNGEKKRPTSPAPPDISDGAGTFVKG